MSEECKEDIKMWKAFLCVLGPFEKRFSRSLLSFDVREPTIKIEYDASLTGMGIIISEIREEQEWRIISHIGMDFPFKEQVMKDSSYQNSCEFIAVVSAICILALMGYKNFSYCLYGDSVSSLSWCTRGDTSSTRARSAAIVFSLINIKIQAKLESTYHVKGKDNIITDKLSRGGKFSDLGLQEEQSLPLETVKLLQKLLILINPYISYMSQGKYDGIRTEGIMFVSDIVRDKK